ncbi:MAG TPA: hypothetical protein VGH54_09805 [Mycobacterium sp.]|jgi:hypothetical protein|uniref:hypothetical protein n=1 Tax=Mycobacterium sp. TaxID=1785 RepID=UPI002F41CD53
MSQEDKRYAIVNRYDGTWRVYDNVDDLALPVPHKSKKAAQAAADRYNERAAKATS